MEAPTCIPISEGKSNQKFKNSFHLTTDNFPTFDGVLSKINFPPTYQRTFFRRLGGIGKLYFLQKENRLPQQAVMERIWLWWIGSKAGNHDLRKKRVGVVYAAEDERHRRPRIPFRYLRGHGFDAPFTHSSPHHIWAWEYVIFPNLPEIFCKNLIGWGFSLVAAEICKEVQ